MKAQGNQENQAPEPLLVPSSTESNDTLEKPVTKSLEKNPLAGMSHGALLDDADRLVNTHGLQQYRVAFRKGALLASAQNNAESHESVDLLTLEEKEICQFEIDHRGKALARKQILQAALCAACAVVQGMDQTVINGAQVSRLTTETRCCNSPLT